MQFSLALLTPTYYREANMFFWDNSTNSSSGFYLYYIGQYVQGNSVTLKVRDDIIKNMHRGREGLVSGVGGSHEANKGTFHKCYI